MVTGSGRGVGATPRKELRRRSADHDRRIRQVRL